MNYIDSYMIKSKNAKRSAERAMDLLQESCDIILEIEQMGIRKFKDEDVMRNMDYAEQYISAIKEYIKEMDEIIRQNVNAEEDPDEDCDDCECRDECHIDEEDKTPENVTTTKEVTETEETEEMDGGFMTDAKNIHFTFTDNATLNIIFGGLY